MSCHRTSPSKWVSSSADLGRSPRKNICLALGHNGFAFNILSHSSCLWGPPSFVDHIALQPEVGKMARGC